MRKKIRTHGPAAGVLTARPAISTDVDETPRDIFGNLQGWAKVKAAYDAVVTVVRYSDAKSGAFLRPAAIQLSAGRGVEHAFDIHAPAGAPPSNDNDRSSGPDHAP